MKTTSIQRSALVLHSAQAMFDLVNDIEAYPQYMEGCSGAEVISRDDKEVIARLDLRKAGISHSFTTRNHLLAPQLVEMTLVDGPFSYFQGVWQFKALQENASKVSLDLEFAFKSGMLNKAAGKLFTRVADNLVAALVKRADDVFSAVNN
jgi:ribosome-associated toxin RatA of RatAB toxin-antitoxin module